jgi:hypothetical protein
MTMKKRISVRLSDKELTLLKTRSSNLSDAVRSCLVDNKDELVFELRSNINKLETKIALLEKQIRYLESPWICRVLERKNHV